MSTRALTENQRRLLDAFDRAGRPLSATEAARLAGLDLITGAAVVYGLHSSRGALRRFNDTKPLRFVRVDQAQRFDLPCLSRPEPGTVTPFGLICGSAHA